MSPTKAATGRRTPKSEAIPLMAVHLLMFSHSTAQLGLSALALLC